MGRFISINKYYFLILGSILIKFLNTFITGFYPTLNNPLFLFGFRPNLLSHPLVKNTFQYFGIILGGLILKLISYKNNQEDENEIILNEFNINTYNLNISRKIYLRKISFDLFSYYFSKITISSLDNLGFHQAKYWTLEFIALYYFTKKF